MALTSGAGKDEGTSQMEQPIIIDTPAGIEHFRMAALIAALKIEVTTGMKMSRGSMLKIAKIEYGCHKNTKAGALEYMLSLYETTYGRQYGAR